MSHPIRTLIVDDEPLARDAIRLLLQTDDEVEIAGECQNGEEALEALNKKDIHLLFLDIQMPGPNGFEVIKRLPSAHMPVVIFATAHDNFALQAFEANAIDYLLKPFTDERFYQALGKAKALVRKENQPEIQKQITHLLRYYERKQGYRQRLSVKVREKIIILDVDEIDWLQASGNYVEISTGQKKFLINDNLKDLENQLDPAEFIRIHRSTIINVRRVRTLEPHFNGEYFITLAGGTRFKLSRSYRHRAEYIMNGL